MNFSNIEDVVRRHVNFSHGIAGGGWNVVFCEVCGDGSRKKGPRGGWSFIDAGCTAFYHCFNCGINESFSTNREHPYSKRMVDVFNSFDIPQNECAAVILANTHGTKRIIKAPAITQHTILEMPDHFIQISDSPKIADFRKFLKTEYNLRTTDYSFFVGTGETKSSDMVDKAIARSMAGRLIIPYYKNSNMIYYQARDITNTHKLKYISPTMPKNNILFNIDQLQRYTTDNLFVVEGAMDAIHLNGVSTLGNELTSVQIQLLKSSSRNKVLVPDFKGDSNRLIEQFIDNGWDVAFPTYRSRCKDVSEAVIKYGKLYTVHDIVTNIQPPKLAELGLRLLHFK